MIFLFVTDVIQLFLIIQRSTKYLQQVSQQIGHNGDVHLNVSGNMQLVPQVLFIQVGLLLVGNIFFCQFVLYFR